MSSYQCTSEALGTASEHELDFCPRKAIPLGFAGKEGYGTSTGSDLKCSAGMHRSRAKPERCESTIVYLLGALGEGTVTPTVDPSKATASNAHHSGHRTMLPGYSSPRKRQQGRPPRRFGFQGVPVSIVRRERNPSLLSDCSDPEHRIRQQLSGGCNPPLGDGLYG